SFRVRNGTGRFPPRYGRRNSMEICTLSRTPAPLVVAGRGWVWWCRYLGNRTVDAHTGVSCVVFVCVFYVFGVLVPVSFMSRWSSLPHPAYQPSVLAGSLSEHVVSQEISS